MKREGRRDRVSLTPYLWGTPVHVLILFLMWGSKLSISQSLNQSWSEETSQPREREGSSPSITTTPHPLCNRILPGSCTNLTYYIPHPPLSYSADTNECNTMNALQETASESVWPFATAINNFAYWRGWTTRINKLLRFCHFVKQLSFPLITHWFYFLTISSFHIRLTPLLYRMLDIRHEPCLILLIWTIFMSSRQSE